MGTPKKTAKKTAAKKLSKKPAKKSPAKKTPARKPAAKKAAPTSDVTTDARGNVIVAGLTGAVPYDPCVGGGGCG